MSHSRPVDSAAGESASSALVVPTATPASAQASAQAFATRPSASLNNQIPSRIAVLFIFPGPFNQIDPHPVADRLPAGSTDIRYITHIRRRNRLTFSFFRESSFEITLNREDLDIPYAIVDIGRASSTRLIDTYWARGRASDITIHMRLSRLLQVLIVCLITVMQIALTAINNWVLDLKWLEIVQVSLQAIETILVFVILS
ncbi:hypothetical protein TWF718_009912 [Orbilia javanica]|uniref:Uncharacterized protein n=1 Tax=Orbilia javanica TaxID=47235 RepID=A0AAN8MQH2_9PEZI